MEDSNLKKGFQDADTIVRYGIYHGPSPRFLRIKQSTLKDDNIEADITNPPLSIEEYNFNTYEWQHNTGLMQLVNRREFDFVEAGDFDYELALYKRIVSEADNITSLDDARLERTETSDTSDYDV